MAWITTKARNIRAGDTVLGKDDWHIKVDKVRTGNAVVIIDGHNGFGEAVRLRRNKETLVTIVGGAK